MQLEESANPLLINLKGKVDAKPVREGARSLFAKDEIRNCDDAFAYYLIHCSDKVNSEFFRVVSWSHLGLFAKPWFYLDNNFGSNGYD